MIASLAAFVILSPTFASSVDPQQGRWREQDNGFKPEAPVMNGLTSEEKRLKFILLYDGKSAENFRGYRKDAMPTAWTSNDGEIRLNPSSNGTRGDIITKEQFDNFELRLSWKVQEGGNSGIMFRATEEFRAAHYTGPEMQVLDDAKHPDGQSELTSAGSNYAIYARSKKCANPAGQWNDVRIIANGAHVEFWLNGEKIVNFELWSDEWTKLVKASKFVELPDYGMRKRGHIALQDHGDVVSYRNIRIRRL